ncbi:MAG: hypothetical protein CM15mP93_16920 [Thiotrichaceae bacterium]|nr:MAG: hypothetical protein CM15mP93_16920 [Thiotrichaceae bacterium]
MGRPTIEIDLMPDFSTNKKIEYHGINGGDHGSQCKKVQWKLREG